MKCDAKTFFGVINAFRSLNLFSLLPLSRQEYMVMFVIAGQRKTNPEGSTVSMVTQKMHVPQPAVSRTLRGLENDGYICREVCRTDRRNTYVTLTAAGSALAAPLSLVSMKLLTAFLKLSVAFSEPAITSSLEIRRSRRAS